MPSPPPQQQRTPGRSSDRDGWIALCYLVAGVLVVACFAALIAWISQPQPRPRFTVVALSVSGVQVTFNVSDSNPNRHYGIFYKSAMRASLLFDGALVASGLAFTDEYWYQPSMNTTSIAGAIDVVEPSLNATLRAGRLPLLLQLSTTISFDFSSVEQSMYVTCVLLVGANGRLRRESVGAPCNTYLGLLDD